MVVRGRRQDSASTRQAGNVCESTRPEQVSGSQIGPIDLGLRLMGHLILCGCQASTGLRGRGGSESAAIARPSCRVSQVTGIRKDGKSGNGPNSCSASRPSPHWRAKTEPVMWCASLSWRSPVEHPVPGSGGPRESFRGGGVFGRADSSRGSRWPGGGSPGRASEGRAEGYAKGRTKRHAKGRAEGHAKRRVDGHPDRQVDRYPFLSVDQKHTGRDPIPPGLDGWVASVIER
ncbi:hypothetical protein EDD92_5527 [Streptomyces sp. TLI_185]|nr:hypothetical protein EDD92_5527 [Streptomyces sp. TLI_185]